MRIPSSLAKDTHLRQGSVVELAIVEGRIVLKPKAESKYSLSQMLNSVTKENLHSSQDWGGAVGKEFL